MDTALWIVVAVAAVVLIAIIVALMSKRRRRTHLRSRFGSEYDRTVDSADSRRRAELDLRDRERRRDELDIKPLSEGARHRYAEQWRNVQALFVDQPQHATKQADHLVGLVMRERGYPIDDWDDRVDLVSVDYPDMVENYRTAHDIAERNDRGDANTEDLRTAMLRYRSLFDALLETEDHVAR